MATRNYSSIHNIKDFAMSELAPKYFNMEETNDLNIGLLGYTTELLGSVGEDSFNTISTYMNEMFPNLAILPESIFNYGALFQIDGTFATASECDMLLFIPEEHIIKYATKSNDTTDSDSYYFYLDSNMTISVEGIRFKPDYNIRISFKNYSKSKTEKDRIYTAMYDMRESNAIYKNTISNIINPYIKLKRINFENIKYLQLEIKTHQVDKYTINDNVVDSTIINLPKYIIEFDDYLANFEVFYKPSNSSEYTQLKKKMLGSAPSEEAFCYYKAIDENRVEISFTSRDNYFQPEYNSEINISYYTTTGEAGNFTEYTGNAINVITSSEIYDYNSSITAFALPMTGAYYGANPPLLEDLKRNVIEKFSTAGSYTNENDLQLYFNNFNAQFKSNILFLKKRDDVFERLFSAFVLLKDETGEIYSTNTVQMELTPKNFDTELAQSDTYIMKPGHVFSYKSGSNDLVQPISNIIDLEELSTMLKLDNPIIDMTVNNYSIYSNADILKDIFLYSNPFLIYFSKSPSDVGYYLTTFENKYILDYTFVNSNSLVQFICNSLTISRNGIIGDNKYKVSVTVTPTTDLDNPMVVENRNPITGAVIDYTINNTINIKLIVLSNEDDSQICYFNMKLESFDLNLDIYTFTCEITTDDYIMTDNKFRVLEIDPDDQTKILGQHIIPMTDCILQLDIGYRYSDNPNTLILTNSYKTKSNPVTFIKPIKMMRSTAQYIYNNDGTIQTDGSVVGGTYKILFNSVPMIKTSTLADVNIYKSLYKTITTQYDYIEDIIDLITNNYAIDIKLYNTYGKSKNFYTDNGNKLNKVNITIKFQVHSEFGIDELELERDIKIFIKEYIENINESGTNTFYISNLIRELENNFENIEYLKFMGINNYSTNVQAIINNTVDMNVLTKNERVTYVPEYLTVNLDNIEIEMI